MKQPLLITAAVLTLNVSLWAAEPRLVVEDRFEGKPAKGWTWLRENPKAWRIAENALEIRVEPGNAATVKNALVRKAPDRSRGKFAAEVTVTNTTAPTRQYEQAGLTWYHDEKPLFKLVKELIDGKTWIVLLGPTDPKKRGLAGKVPMPAKTVQLRIIVTADRYTGQFRPDAKGEFQPAGSGPLPPAAKDQISIQCYNGPPDAEHWMRFDDFRLLQLPD